MTVELSILTGKWQNTGGSQMTADDVEKTSLRRNTTSQYFLDRKRVKIILWQFTRLWLPVGLFMV